MTDRSAERHATNDAERGSWPWTLFTWPLVMVWLICGALACLLLGGIAALLGDRDRHVAHRILGLAYSTGIRSHPTWSLRFTGLENLRHGPFVLCSNHQSYLDVVCLYGLPLQFKWVIKKELFRVPLFGACMRLARYPAIDRGDPDSAVRLLHLCRQILATGTSVLIFPEGTRSTTGELGPFASGAVRLALESRAPLLPIGVAGTADVLPVGSGKFSPHARMVVHIGAPIPTTGLDRRGARRLRQQLRQAVGQAKHEAQQQLARSGKPVDAPEPRGAGQAHGSSLDPTG